MPAPLCRQLTFGPGGQVIANRGCWSHCGRLVLFDQRVDETRFDGREIQAVDVESLETVTLYRSPPGTPCGVPTCCGVDDRYVFIHADEAADDGWEYNAWHRRGAIGRIGRPGEIATLDARDVMPPFTAGALRGGTHLHTFNAAGTALLSTYEDHVLAASDIEPRQANRRCVALHLLERPVAVPKTHPRNHDGVSFSVLVSELADQPAPGSDEINYAAGEAWVAERNELAMHGTVIGPSGEPHVEVFFLSLPENLFGSPLTPALSPAKPGASGRRAPPPAPLAGTETTRPAVPAEVIRRRLTHTADRRYPGVAGPRHWSVSSPDGKRIGFYMRDDSGIARFWTVSPAGGDPVQVTRGGPPPTSPFTWHPDGSRVAYVADRSIVTVDLDDGRLRRLTEPEVGHPGPTHHACVFSPDGTKIAFMQPDPAEPQYCRLFVVDCP